MSAIIPANDFPTEAYASVAAIAKQAFESIDQEEFSIWEQLPREPQVWYERFSEYLLMESYERGILKICNRQRIRGGLPPIAALPKEWKLHTVAWRWKDRALAFDTFRVAEERRLEERRKKEAKRRRLSILSSFEDKVVQGIEVFNPDTDSFRLSELVSAIKTLGQESRAEFDDGPVKRSEVKITTMADLLRDAEREEYGDNIIDGEWR